MSFSETESSRAAPEKTYKNYGIITKNDARTPGKQIYKAVLIGGDTYDTTPDDAGDVASKCGEVYRGRQMPPCSIPSRIGGDVKNGLITFKSGEITGQTPYPTHLDFAALEELTRTITKLGALARAARRLEETLRPPHDSPGRWPPGEKTAHKATDVSPIPSPWRKFSPLPVEASGGAESPRTTNDRMRYMGRGGGPGAV